MSIAKLLQEYGFKATPEAIHTLQSFQAGYGIKLINQVHKDSHYTMGSDKGPMNNQKIMASYERQRGIPVNCIEKQKDVFFEQAVRGVNATRLTPIQLADSGLSRLLLPKNCMTVRLPIMSLEMDNIARNYSIQLIPRKKQ